MINNHFPMIS